jgi:hypothetical protein
MENGEQPDLQRGIGTEELCAEIRHGFADCKKTLRDVQTELLKAFYGFAHRIDTGVRESEIAGMILRQRLTDAESRVTKIEKRINISRQQVQ